MPFLTRQEEEVCSVLPTTAPGPTLAPFQQNTLLFLLRTSGYDFTWARVFADILSYLCVCVCVCVCVLSRLSYPTLCDPMDCSPPGSSDHGDSPGKNTGVGCHALLQGIFQTQGSNLSLPPALAGKFFTMSTSWKAPVISRSEHPGLSRHALCPMTGILIKGRRGEDKEDMKMAT